MKIFDYSTNRELRDVAIHLSHEETRELASYLNRLASQPEIHKIYLSQIVRNRLEKELTVTIDAA